MLVSAGKAFGPPMVKSSDCGAEGLKIAMRALVGQEASPFSLEARGQDAGQAWRASAGR